MSILMEKVPVPVIGNRYHLSWSNNQFMTWELVCIYSDGTCRVKSKIRAFNVNLTDLRKKPSTSVKPKNQLKLNFKHSNDLILC